VEEVKARREEKTEEKQHVVVDSYYTCERNGGSAMKKDERCS
jgi:hypothetical protein